jgi:hypothetical protein
MGLQDIINNLFENSPSYVNGVSFGFKNTNQKYTKDLAIIFNVNKKLPYTQIPKEEFIPKFIDVDGVNYLTDVVENNIPINLGCFNFSEDSPSAQVIPHRLKQRPIKGGIVISSTSNCVYSANQPSTGIIKPLKVGTLGAIVVDNENNTFAGLTAAHVLCKEVVYANQRNLEDWIAINSIYSQQLDAIDSGNNLLPFKTPIRYNQNIFQFKDFSGSGIDINNDTIGFPKRYIPLSITGNKNSVDAGIFAIEKSVFNLKESNEQLGLPNSLRMPFATDQEIYDIFTGQKSIFSAGRTTGPKGIGCNLKITNLYASQYITGYNKENQLTGINFTGLIAFGDGTNSHSAEGDSGAILFAESSGQNKILGLVFAAPITGPISNAYACNINRIAEQLNISAWTGEVRDFDNPNTISAFKSSGNGSEQKLGDSFQVGLLAEFTEGPIDSNLYPTSNTITHIAWNPPDVSNYANPSLGSLTIDPNKNLYNFLPYFAPKDSEIKISNIGSIFYQNLAYQVIGNAVVSDSFGVPISDAVVIFRVDVLNTSCDCCNIYNVRPNYEEKYTKDLYIKCPEAPSLKGKTLSSTSLSDGRVFFNYTNEDRDYTCFKIQILDILKEGYQFKYSENLHKAVVCANTFDIGNPGPSPVPPPSPGPSPTPPPPPPPPPPPFPPPLPGPGPGPNPGGLILCDEFSKGKGFEIEIQADAFCVVGRVAGEYVLGGMLDDEDKIGARWIPSLTMIVKKNPLVCECTRATFSVVPKNGYTFAPITLRKDQVGIFSFQPVGPRFGGQMTQSQAMSWVDKDGYGKVGIKFYCNYNSTLGGNCKYEPKSTQSIKYYDYYIPTASEEGNKQYGLCDLCNYWDIWNDDNLEKYKNVEWISIFRKSKFQGNTSQAQCISYYRFGQEVTEDCPTETRTICCQGGEIDYEIFVIRYGMSKYAAEMLNEFSIGDPIDNPCMGCGRGIRGSKNFSGPRKIQRCVACAGSDGDPNDCEPCPPPLYEIECSNNLALFDLIEMPNLSLNITP